MPKETLFFGADHGGVILKDRLVAWVKAQHPSLPVTDLGTHGPDSVDYPDIALNLAMRVVAENACGVLVCGTGNGMAMTANKVAGIRAALAYNRFTGEMAKAHNHANVLCMGGRTTAYEDAVAALQAWLETKAEGGRHNRRVAKILELDRKPL